MAYIRAHSTTQKRKGRVQKRYEVVWREPVRDSYGLPVPMDPAKPEGKKKTQARQESFAAREDAEARRDELNAAKHTGQASALAEQRKAGDLPFGYYGRAWLDSQQVKVSQGRLKQKTLDGYDKIVRHYLLPAFGSKATAAISPKDCEDFLTSLVRRQSRQNGGEPLKPGTVKHAWNGLRRVMKYAMQHGAITNNPCDRVDYDGGRATGDREKFQHHPLSAEQVGKLSAAVAGEVGDLPAYPEYALMVEFLAYSGLRASENSGLEIGDLSFITRPGADGNTTRCTVRVARTKDRKGGQWITSTPKSRKSRRSVPLPPWLSERLREYVSAHSRADEPSAPLWPSRRNGGGYRAKGQRYAVPLDWSQPVYMGTFYDTILKPALEAVGLPASRPATSSTPVQHGVRLHDLRHTFAVMQLMAGTHFMQVSRWMGHSTFTLTLDTYGDWIPEEDGGALNDLPEPSAPENAVDEPERSNVVPLFGNR